MLKKIDDVNIEYSDAGEGKPVLLLHGFGGCGASFTPTTEFLMQRGNRVIALDMPGFGGSDQPPEAWSIDEYAINILSFIRLSKLDKVDVVAHSFGARVVIRLAADHPEVFNNIVLTGAAGLIPKRGVDYYAKVYSYKIGKKLSNVSFIDKIFKISEKSKNAGSEEYKQLSGSMKGTYIKVVNQNLRPYLSSIKSSVLLIWGEDDTATPLWMGEVMEKEIPNAGIVVFKNAGHFAYLEQNQRFNAIINEFLWR